jgi:hypothetical protein
MTWRSPHMQAVNCLLYRRSCELIAAYESGRYINSFTVVWRKLIVFNVRIFELFGHVSYHHDVWLEALGEKHEKSQVSQSPDVDLTWNLPDTNEEYQPIHRHIGSWTMYFVHILSGGVTNDKPTTLAKLYGTGNKVHIRRKWCGAVS